MSPSIVTTTNTLTLGTRYSILRENTFHQRYSPVPNKKYVFVVVVTLYHFFIYLSSLIFQLYLYKKLYNHNLNPYYNKKCAPKDARKNVFPSIAATQLHIHQKQDIMFGEKTSFNKSFPWFGAYYYVIYVANIL